jgi:hypothetical protein
VGCEVSGFVLPKERALAVMRGEVTRVYVSKKPTHIYLGYEGEYPQITDVANVLPVSYKKGVIRSEYIMFRLGKSYPVRTAGEKALCHAEITCIEWEDVRRTITEDAQAAGYAGLREFWGTWLAKHAPHILKREYLQKFRNERSEAEYVDALEGAMLAFHKDEPFQAWAFTVELVQSGPR